MSSLSAIEQRELRNVLSKYVLRMESSGQTEAQKLRAKLQLLLDKSLANWADCEEGNLNALRAKDLKTSQRLSEDAEKWLDVAAEIKAVLELTR